MSEILLCKQSLSASALEHQCGITIDQVSALGCANPSMLAANTPYSIDPEGSGLDHSILSQLSPMPVARELTSLTLSFGDDNVVALAEMTAKLNEYNLGLLGAATSVYAGRVGNFAGAVKEYQSALMGYREAVTAKSSLQSAAKQKAFRAFEKMQSQFRNELNALTAQAKARRGVALTNPERATNIARSSRSVAKLNVTGQVQANQLVRLSKHAKFLGNGLAVIDFGSRIGNVHNSYKAGGNWERDLFIESSSFAASAVAGTMAVNAGAAALTFLMVATPVGWVGLIVGGVAVAGVAAATSMGVNQVVKEDAGGIYDSVMQLVSSW